MLTPLEGILLSALPPYDGAPPGVIGGALLAGFANLFLIAVVAPLADPAIAAYLREWSLEM